MLLTLVGTAWASHVGGCSVLATVQSSAPHPQGWSLTIQPLVEPACGRAGILTVVYTGSERPPDGHAVSVHRRVEGDVTGTRTTHHVLEVWPADQVCTLEGPLRWSPDAGIWWVRDPETAQPAGCPTSAQVAPAAWMVAEAPSRLRKDGVLGEWVVVEQHVDGRWRAPTAEQRAVPATACRQEFVVQDTYVTPGRASPTCQGLARDALALGWSPELPASFWAVHTADGWTVDGNLLPTSPTGGRQCWVTLTVTELHASGWATVSYAEPPGCGVGTRVVLIPDTVAPQVGGTYRGQVDRAVHGHAPVRLQDPATR